MFIFWRFLTPLGNLDAPVHLKTSRAPQNGLQWQFFGKKQALKLGTWHCLAWTAPESPKWSHPTYPTPEAITKFFSASPSVYPLSEPTKKEEHRIPLGCHPSAIPSTGSHCFTALDHFCTICQCIIAICLWTGCPPGVFVGVQFWLHHPIVLHWRCQKGR